jgi:hypothetical protein
LRLNPVVLVASLLVGLGGLFFGVRALLTYNDAAEAFTQVELVYVRGSFQWQDAEYDQGTATFQVVNRSRFRAVVESFRISVYFDGEFAGSDYDALPDLIVPGHETREISAHFSITTNSIQNQGGTANLAFGGQTLVRFAKFEQPLSFRFRGTIGQVEFDDS